MKQDGKKVFLFVAGLVYWNYIYPALPEIERDKSKFTFIRVEPRDEYMELAKLWDVYGIPSLVVLDNDKEIGPLSIVTVKLRKRLMTLGLK